MRIPERIRRIGREGRIARRRDLATGDLIVDEFMCFRNFVSIDALVSWPAAAIASADLVIPDLDPVSLAVAPAGASHARLTFFGIVPEYRHVHEAWISVWADGRELRFDEPVMSSLVRDPWRRLTADFHRYLHEQRRTGRVLELGSRTRADTRSAVRSRDSFFPPELEYVGVDIVPGKNVDVVADAHRLSEHVPLQHFDVVYSDFVFEHLLMPWVVVVELNKVLRPGGDVFVNTNQTIALHDMPWDFWRFSDTVWHALFNEFTGFEIIGAALGEQVRITPSLYHGGFVDHHWAAGFQASAVWARKSGEATVRWDADPAVLLSKLDKPYPLEIS